MNGYVGLRDDRRDGERLATRIGLLFPGPSAAWLQRAERLRRQQASAGLGSGAGGLHRRALADFGEPGGESRVAAAPVPLRLAQVEIAKAQATPMAAMSKRACSSAMQSPSSHARDRAIFSRCASSQASQRFSSGRTKVS